MANETILEELRKIQERCDQRRAELAQLEAQQKDLSHQAVREKVKALFPMAEGFMGYFDTGLIEKKFCELKKMVQECLELDPGFMKNLSSANYYDVEDFDAPERQYAVQLLGSGLFREDALLVNLLERLCSNRSRPGNPFSGKS